MNILVTGGAGYIGSVVAEELINGGYRVIIVDNLRQGHKDAVPTEAEFINADICDMSAIDRIFGQFAVDAVVHLAGETAVGHSMTNPGIFFRSNVIGGMNIIDAMVKHNVRKLIFSSSAAVYGEPRSVPIQEDHPLSPVNSYGESKMIFERVLAWYEKAYGLKSISLRYFNAGGATVQRGEDHHPETHLIPLVLSAALCKRGSISVFGTDYPTADGSCVRDYVHVVDIARAHILALERIDRLRWRAYNMGNENGYSVMQVIDTAKMITGANIITNISSRRDGDPAILVASAGRAREELEWKPRFPGLEAIISDAWKWMKVHPDGYR